MSTYIYIIDDLVFFFVGIVILYLFVLAVASHFKRIVYPKAEKKYHCAILVPEESPLPVIYREESYEFFTYNDLHQGINTLDKVWGIERSGFFNGREKWAKGFENQRV